MMTMRMRMIMKMIILMITLMTQLPIKYTSRAKLIEISNFGLKRNNLKLCLHALEWQEDTVKACVIHKQDQNSVKSSEMKELNVDFATVKINMMILMLNIVLRLPLLRNQWSSQ